MLNTALVVSFLVCCRLEVRCGYARVVSGLQVTARALVCRPDTTPAKPHLTSNPQQTKNERTNLVINIIVTSRELLMMGTVVPETC